MARYVALLRGIGPSDPNMRNVRLREVCEKLGFRNVQSVVSSGNLVFDADTSDREELEARLEAAWPEHLGFQSTSIVRTCDEVAALVERDPFAGLEHGQGSYLLVTFTKTSIEPSFTPPHTPDGAAFTIVGGTDRELFSVSDTTRASTPDAMTWLEREFGKAITSRTWLTVQRILRKCVG